MNSRDHNTPKLKRKKYLPLLHRYAVTFNGVDEYLTLPLPNNDLLASPGVSDFYSVGSAIAGIVEYGTVAWNGTTSGKTYANTILLSAESGISKAISGLRVGQKYKLKIRYQAGTVGLNIASEQYGSDYFNLPDTFGEWNTTSKVFTAVSTTIWIGCEIEAAILDWVSVKHDQGLDANKDQEMILYSGDANFNNPTTRWVPKDGSSNQTCALSTVDKAEGTGSNLITATGAGDATDNYVKLPFEFLEPLVAGKKYTLEGKARLDPASLSYGSDLVGGVDFTSASWVKTDLSVTKVDANSLSITTNNNGVYRTYLTIGKVYKVITSGLVSGNIKIMHGGTDLKIYTTNFSETFYFKAQSTFLYIKTGAAGPTILDDFTLILQQADDVIITNQIGTKSVNSGALSIVQGSFTKFVLNFEATASEVNADWKSYLSGVGAVFVDGLSLTQSFDMIRAHKFKSNTDNAGKGIMWVNGSMYFEIKPAGQTRNQLSDDVSGADNRLTTYTKDVWVNYISLLDRTNRLFGIKNGVSDAGVVCTSIGKFFNTTSALNIGANNVGTERFNGQIATVEIIRFDNIALTDFNPNTYQPGHKITDLGGGVPEVVLHLDPKDGSSVANMLKDYSPKGHTITAVNIDLSNRVVVRN